MEEYYPDDIVIRTKVSVGMKGRIIECINKAQDAYSVEVLCPPTAARQPWTPEVGETQTWQAIYFQLFHREKRIPDWEV
jgi:hypothetical protein